MAASKRKQPKPVPPMKVLPKLWPAVDFEQEGDRE